MTSPEQVAIVRISKTGRNSQLDLEGIVMFVSSINRSLLLGFALVTCASPLVAQGPDDETVVNAKRYQERVGFEDLDLRLRSDQRMLKTRVRHASTRVCHDMAHDGVIIYADKRLCSAQTYRETQPQIRRAIARVEAGERIAFALTIGISKKKV
jgi:UrcA family protein